MQYRNCTRKGARNSKEKDVKMYIGDTENNTMSEGNGLFEIISYDGLPNISELSKDGILILFRISGELAVSSKGSFMTLDAGDCAIFFLKSENVFFPANKDDGKTACAFIRGTLASGLAEMYGINKTEVLRGLDVSFEMFGIRRVLSSDETSECEKKRDALMAVHRLFSKAGKAVSAGNTVKKNTATLIRGYIDTHIDGKLTLDELSATFFVSKTQIFRMFKESYGMAPMQYFLHKKIEYAKHLLATTDKHMAEIAEELSFTDAKHFSKTFKNYAGVLPRDYKKQIKNKK